MNVQIRRTENQLNNIRRRRYISIEKEMYVFFDSRT